MLLLSQLPVLEVTPTQERLNVEIAESDIFYRTALESKLMSLENTLSSEQTLSDQTNVSVANVTLQTSAKEQRRMFNLQKLLVNAVYPEECTQQAEQQLVNASFIQNHVSGGSSSNYSMREEHNDEAAFLDDTLVDEQLMQTNGPLPHDATRKYLLLLDSIQTTFHLSISTRRRLGTARCVAATGRAKWQRIPH